MKTLALGVLTCLSVTSLASPVTAQSEPKPDIRKPETASVAPAAAGSAAEAAPAKQPDKPAATAPKPKPVMNPPFGMFKDAKLPMIQRSVLNGVDGRIDKMAVDLISGRLYVAAKSKGSLEMLDPEGSKQQPPVVDLPEPTGLLVISDLRKLVLSCARDNSVRVFSLTDTGDPMPERVIKFEGETECVRYDAAANRVYVGHGWKLGSFSLETGERGKSIDLPHAPEGFVIDPGSDRIYVNIAQRGAIAVLKRSEGGELSLETTWSLKDLKGNYPMALDPSNGHLFVVCRNAPAKLVVVDTRNGNQVAAVDCTDDADDCWWDAVQKRIYVSCGGNGGFVDCFQQESSSGAVTGYKRYHQERTNVGCRTSVFTPEHRRLIVAAPKIGGADPTFIYIFLVGP